MKHDWKRDWEDAVKIFDDAYPYYVKCSQCGSEFDVTTMGYDATFTLEPGADEPCPGLDLTAVVTVSIAHPGKATEHSDRSSGTMRVEISLADIVHHKADPVVEKLHQLVEAISGGWRGVRTEHEPAWRAAVEAASRSAEDTTEEVR